MEECKQQNENRTLESKYTDSKSDIVDAPAATNQPNLTHAPIVHRTSEI